MRLPWNPGATPAQITRTSAHARPAGNAGRSGTAPAGSPPSAEGAARARCCGEDREESVTLSRGGGTFNPRAVRGRDWFECVLA